MALSAQIAKHFREVYFGGNWTFSNLKDTLTDINWQKAITKVHSFNTIYALVFHMDYFVRAVTEVLKGNPLDAHDKFSFDATEIQSEEQWNNFTATVFANAENFAVLIENIPDNQLFEIFSLEKYGNYYRNLHGIIEHNHYHLGQIALIKKILLEN